MPRGIIFVNAETASSAGNGVVNMLLDGPNDAGIAARPRNGPFYSTTARKRIFGSSGRNRTKTTNGGDEKRRWELSAPAAVG
jgi:hypothetical protein